MSVRAFNLTLVQLTRLAGDLQRAHATARDLGLATLADALYDHGRDVADMIGRHAVSHGLGCRCRGAVVSPTTEALLYVAALSPFAAGALCAVIVLLRDRRASSYVPRGLPPSFQLPTVAGTKARIIVPSARQLERSRKRLRASLSNRNVIVNNHVKQGSRS